MTGRSLQASKEGIEKAKKALADNSLNQTSLAEVLSFSRGTVNNFFAGKPVDRKYFGEICEKLGFEWEDIVTKLHTQPEAKANPDTSIDIDAIVQEVRQKIKPLIEERCGTMRVLDMNHPIELNDIYTSVNILQTITGQRGKNISELLEEYTNDDFDRFGLGRIEERVPGLEAVKEYPRLMILGKPGAGKTTFLKYLAIQCIRGKLQTERVPIFVTLKDFAEDPKKPSLLDYIVQLLTDWGVLATQVANLFAHGRAFVLLDGLDEVKDEDNGRVINSIRNFSEKYFISKEFVEDSQKYSKQIQDFYLEYFGKDTIPISWILKWLSGNFPNKFYINYFNITCRIAANEYKFTNFTEVEVAEFEDEQIFNFASKWFHKSKVDKPETFLKTFLKRLEDNNRIKQLATSPLLLTLLCLVFERTLNFPANRSELYEEGVDALLKTWDASRGIERVQVYKKLSPKRKEELLCNIALITFKEGNYFFKRQQAEKYIEDYICNLTDANTDKEALEFDSKKVLKLIEAQHGLLVERAKGIYSFSHLTFHEYFTAREIVIGKQLSEEALENLASHTMEKRWREVLLLAIGMLSSADRLLLLMKKQVDKLVAGDDKLQQFLIWVSQKSMSVKVSCKSVVVRAFYFTLDPAHNNLHKQAQDIVRDFNQDITSNHELHLDLYFAHALDLARNLVQASSDSQGFSFIRNRDFFDHNSVFDLSQYPELKQVLQQIPSREDWTKFKQWRKANGQNWIDKLRAAMIKYRNIRDWKFTNEQEELLKQYYDANQLLIECLNSDCYVSLKVRQQIEDTLLLPIAEIEKRQQQF